MLTRSRCLSIGIFLLALVLGCHVSTAIPPGPVAVQAPQTPQAPPIQLPNKEGSLKFAVLGDFGTGERPQYEVAEQMAKLHARFPYEIVVTTGDNLYGSEGPQDFVRKFERPYKPLLDANVKFFAALGNHDTRDQARYKLFNMDGKLYHTFKAPKQDVRFFVLDSTQLTPDQITWLEKELQDSDERWKIPHFHHPLYSSGERHGSDLSTRQALEPLFIKYGVSVVLTGHDHFYERIKPQNGIVYFVVGSGGQLRRGNIDTRTGLTAKGFDTDLAFMAAEIVGDEMYFNAISRQGTVVDSGVIQRRKPE
jgi:3',5'-cyclic AMP phosphodiesterase CpdA